MNDNTLRRGPIVASMLIGSIITLLSQTLLNVALPSMQQDLGVSTNTIQWLMNGYMLVNGVLVPVSAYLIERFSTRRLYFASMGLFFLGTLISAIAPNFGILLAGRLVQAAGGGIMMPLSMLVFLTIFPVEKRGRAMGMMGLAMVFAPAVGPTLSGWIVEHFSWRVIFYVFMPLSLLAWIFGYYSIRNVTRPSSHKLDIPGAVLSTLGFGGLLYGFSEAGNQGWTSPAVISILLIGAVSLILFIWRQLGIQHPMLEFRVFKYNMFSLTTAITGIVTMAMFSGMILIPIYMQTLRGFTPLESGLVLLPGALVMGLMSPVTGVIFDKIGSRWLAVIGLIIVAVSTYEFSRLTLDTPFVYILVMHAIRMFGMSIMMMPVQTEGINQLPQRLNAHGTAMSQTLRNVFGALGTALLVTVMSNRANARTEELLQSGHIDPQNQAAMSEITREALLYGIDSSFQVATGLAVAALLLAFFVRRVTPHDQSRKAASGSKVEQTKPALGN